MMIIILLIIMIIMTARLVLVGDVHAVGASGGIHSKSNGVYLYVISSV